MRGTEGASESLGERRLAGPHLAGDQDDVALASQAGHGGRHTVGVVERLGA